jgi:RimJ/RimL family protein N-acetyltransferase
MPPTIFLETDRLYLRRLTPGDAPLLSELDSDPEVMRYISKGQPTPLATIEEEVLPRWLAWYEQGDHVGYWAAHEKVAGVFIGWFHFRPSRDAPHDMELGYRLKREAWGKGFATEGSNAINAKAFTEWDVAHIYATTLEANKDSHRVMDKCGLRF